MMLSLAEAEAEARGTQLMNQLEIAKNVFHGKDMVNKLLLNAIPSAARCFALSHRSKSGVG